MKMGEGEFKKDKDDVIANVRKVGNWVTWQERGNKRNLKEDYKKLIISMGRGLTKTGQLLFQESCQAYVYAVLGSQAKTRWKIVGDGANSFQTQKVFLNLVDEIVAQNNLSVLIKSMRMAIQQTNVRLDFCMSPGLELIPSEMIYIKDNPGYNNVLLISNNNFKFGINNNVNKEEKRVSKSPSSSQSPSPSSSSQSTSLTTSQTDNKIKSQPKDNHLLATSLITAFVLRFIWLAL